MARKGKKAKVELDKVVKFNSVQEIIDFLYTNKIQKEDIGERSEELIKYAGANENLARAFIDYRDGLKIVVRRVVYATYLLCKKYGYARFQKVAKIVGDTQGNYHPHGDSPIFDVATALASDWEIMLPLLRRGGNFGSQFGDTSAAMRYVEATLSDFAVDNFMFKEWFDGIVPMKDSYNGIEKEPIYLPTRYPSMLFNPCMGMGYSHKNDIPPHNFTDICKIVIKYIKTGKIDLTKLMPDSPVKCLVIDHGDMESMYMSGTGKYVSRAIIEMDYENREILISNVPFRVESQNIVNKITELVTGKIRKGGKVIREVKPKIKGIVDLKDDSNLTRGVHITLIIDKSYDMDEIKEKLYKLTDLEKTHQINYRVVYNYKNSLNPLYSLIPSWVSTRKIIERRKIYHNVNSIKEEIHTNDILIRIIKEGKEEECMKIIKSRTQEEGVQYFIDNFGASPLQAKTFLKAPMSTYSSDNRIKLERRQEKLNENYKELYEFIINPDKIEEKIIDELEQGIKKYGKPRNTIIIKKSDLEKSVPKGDFYIAITEKGYIKKMDAKSSLNIGKLSKGDRVINVIKVSNLTDIKLFTTTGKSYNLPTYKIPSSSSKELGYLLDNYLNINGRVINFMPKLTIQEDDETFKNYFIVSVTKNNVIKKTHISKMLSTINNTTYMKLNVDDEVVDVKMITDETDILVYTKTAHGIRFNTSDIKETGRSTKGVKVFNALEEDQIVGMEVIHVDDTYIVVCTEKGYMKKTELSSMGTSNRCSKVVKLSRLEKDDNILIVRTKKDKSTLVVVKRSGMEELDLGNVPVLSRMAKGKKLVAVPNGDRIIDIQ